MNTLPIQSDSVDNCIEELKNMRAELQRVLQQHKLLLTEHKLLKQKVDEMTDKTDAPYASTRVEEGKYVIEAIIHLLQETGRPMQVKEIGEALKSKNVIPIQILNTKTYVNRRLEIATASNTLEIIHLDDQSKKYYYLPEWADANGSIQHLLEKNNIQF